MKRQNKHRYDYMLGMQRPQPGGRARMPMMERAAQFGAFRALSGYEEAILETGRVTNEKMELGECQQTELDMKLRYIKENLGIVPEISVTYFIPDDRKQGGVYAAHTGYVRQIKEFEKQVIFEDGTEIPIEEIYAINSNIFCDME